MKKKISLINGPNLNLLGTRQPAIYGTATLDSILHMVSERAKQREYEVAAFQSNYEGAVIDAVQQAATTSNGLLINAGAYTHSSLAIRDALEHLSIPKVEVHLSNIHRREEFRRVSVLSPVVDGVICGFGAQSYLLGLEAVINLIEQIK